MDTTITVLLAVASALLTIYMAYQGVHVTLHPTDDPITRKHYKIKFLACGAVAVLLIAFQAAKNAQTQSAIRRQLAEIEHNTKQPPTVQVTNNMPPPTVINSSKSSADEATEKARRSIQGKISRYIDTGNSLRTRFFPGSVYPDKDQHEWALSVQSWHKAIENYLKTIPRGNVYLARFRSQSRGNESYLGGGMTPEYYETWKLLMSDQQKLEEFLQDPSIGAP